MLEADGPLEGIEEVSLGPVADADSNEILVSPASVLKDAD